MSRALASFSKREFNVGNPYNAVGEAEKPGKKEVIRGLARAGSCDQPRDLHQQKERRCCDQSAGDGLSEGWLELRLGCPRRLQPSREEPLSSRTWIHREDAGTATAKSGSRGKGRSAPTSPLALPSNLPPGPPTG